MDVRMLFLTAFIASSGVPSVQPKIQTGIKAIADEVNADSAVQQNLRNLFDSLSKNDLSKTDNLRDLLEREAVKAQKAFDTMKGDLRLAREKTAHRQRNLYRNGDIGERAAVFKRETGGNVETAEAAIGLSISPYELSDEDRYVKQFGNNPNTSREWDRMKEYFGEADLLKARKLCAAAHKRMYGNHRFMIDVLEYKNGTLLFNNPKYQPMRLAYVEYNLQKRDMPEDLREYSVFNAEEHYFLTQGFHKGVASTEPGQKMKKLPIGISSIREILQNGYIYVDKTGFIYDLLLEHQYDYLMVRPKGFGKTLFLSTLEEIFKGNKDLFEGTEIHRRNYNWLKYTVLHFDFSRLDCQDARQFENSLKGEMKKMAEANKVAPLQGVDLQTQLRRLVEDVSQKSGARVVILVDEYDVPVTNSLTDAKMVEKFRHVLSNFVQTVMSLTEQFLQFTFITGVHQYSVCGPMGCGKDPLSDLTFEPKYATLMGFTKADLETKFSDYTSQCPAEETRGLCNGYRFTQNEDYVYNPVSILTYLEAQHPQNHTYNENIPPYLIDMIRRDPSIIFTLRSSATAGFSLGTPIEPTQRAELEPFLFQMGYLTVRGYNERDNWGPYKLVFRNEAVKTTFFSVVLQGLTKLDPVEIRRDGDKMKQYLATLDVNSFVATLHVHITRIPIELRNDASLEYYRAIFHLLMENYGMDTTTELQYTSTEIADFDVLFKFTLEQSAEAALARVMETPKSQSKKVLCVGIDFSVEMSDINDWKAAFMDDGKAIREFSSQPSDSETCSNAQ